MEISKVLFDEITKLSKSEWDRLSISISHLYSVESRKNEKKIYLDPDTAKDRLDDCPCPIQLRSE